MIIGDIYFEDYSPPKQMRPGEYEDICFYVKNIGDEAGYIWVDHYRNGILIRNSVEALQPNQRVHLFTPGYVEEGDGQAEYEIRVGHFTNYPQDKIQDGLLYFVIQEEVVCSDYTNQTDCIAVGCHWWSDGTCHDYPEPPEWITCYRCKPVGNGYTIPESNEFEGNVCPEGWYETQPPCNVPPCSFYTNRVDCIIAGCYWWSDATCHSTPEEIPPPAIPWVPIIAGIAIAAVAGVIVWQAKKK